jgi:hypothetical protein
MREAGTKGKVAAISSKDYLKFEMRSKILLSTGFSSAMMSAFVP